MLSYDYNVPHDTGYNKYHGGGSVRRLTRVEFIIGSNSFKFAINPQQMEETYPARNVFLQTENRTQMQGFGQGLHTITLSGTTGVRDDYDTDQNAPSRGFRAFVQMRDLFRKQLNTYHDIDDSAIQAGTQNPSDTTDANNNATSDQTQSDETGSVALTFNFMNYTDDEYYKVEFGPEGFNFTQSKDDPLSFYYSINLVVVGDASDPEQVEKDQAILGNHVSSMSKKEIEAKEKMAFDKMIAEDIKKYKAHIDTIIKKEDQYKVVDVSKGNYSALRTKVKAMLKDMKNRGVDGTRSTIINYNDESKKEMYSYGHTVTGKKLRAIYAKVYTGITKKVHIKVGNSHIMDIDISSDNPKAWKAYWKMYTNKADHIKNKNGVIDYGQINANDADANDSDYDTDDIHHDLYKNTVPELDLTPYGDKDAIYQQLFGNVLSKLSPGEYSAATQALKSGIENTIINYGQIDAGDANKTISPKNVQEIYSQIMQTVPDVDFAKYAGASELFAMLRGTTSGNENGQITTGGKIFSRNQPNKRQITELYNLMYGGSLDPLDAGVYSDALAGYEENDDLDAGIYAKLSTLLDSSEQETQGVSSFNTTNYSGYSVLDTLDKQATIRPTTNKSWESVTGSSTAEADYHYVNPNVSDSAPYYATNEIDNILKI